MARPPFIELGRGRDQVRIPILHEDRSVIAIDKPAYWMLVPFTWQRTNRNLQAAIASSLGARDWWAKSRNLKFLRYVHRLDAETTGVLLFAKSPGAVESLGDLFESRKMSKRYLAVVQGVPEKQEWICRARLAPAPGRIGRVIVDSKNGKEAETAFRVMATKRGLSLIEARPVTGRTHQIRVHLLEAGSPIVGDPLYGPNANKAEHPSKLFPLGLRAIELSYRDPFRRQPVRIQASEAEFLGAFGFRAEHPPVCDH